MDLALYTEPKKYLKKQYSERSLARPDRAAYHGLRNVHYAGVKCYTTCIYDDDDVDSTTLHHYV